MNKFLELSQEDRNGLIFNTGEKLKMSNAIIEKDFWICFMLKYLFTTFKYKDFICFKGGTSLSKVYKCIELFIEELDPQTICFKYPRVYQDNSILQVIRLEFSALSEPVPANNKIMRSYIVENYPHIFVDEEIHVKTVDIHRTFFKKLLFFIEKSIVLTVIIQLDI